MKGIPLLIDAAEAIEYYHNHPMASDAIRAYIVGRLNHEGLCNREIREALGIEQVYVVTHLKRAGTLLTEEELNLWHQNPKKITLGHVRAVAKFPYDKREPLLRNLLIKRISVSKFEKMARGQVVQKDVDVKRLERVMGEFLGRAVSISYNSNKRTGKLTLDFYTLQDLDHLNKALGYAKKKEF